MEHQSAPLTKPQDKTILHGVILFFQTQMHMQQLQAAAGAMNPAASFAAAMGVAGGPGAAQNQLAAAAAAAGMGFPPNSIGMGILAGLPGVGPVGAPFPQPNVPPGDSFDTLLNCADFMLLHLSSSSGVKPEENRSHGSLPSGNGERVSVSGFFAPCYV